MKPGLYRIGFGAEGRGAFHFLIRIKAAKPNEARVIKVEEANDTVTEAFTDAIIYADSIQTGKEPVFKSKGAKPLQLKMVVESKAVASLPT